MSVTAAFFYLFAGITVASAVLVIASRNPVHSVLFLILAFVNAAGLFVLLGAEFLAMILVVVYVGAVAVLFLFVIMLLDVDFASLKQGVLQYLPIGGTVGVIFLVELVLVVSTYAVDPALLATQPMPGEPLLMTNTAALGSVLYTRYVYFFQLAGLVLLVAMIGAIVLTLRDRVGVKRQDAVRQALRTKEEAIGMTRPPIGKGLGASGATPPGATPAGASPSRTREDA
ncbi:NADH-quinone oxidoreductase subunit J [Salinarimonas ramus]|uniref:NADH-quinone oxidoreductase subunit J n=1 Tax=Salinarimonas ramus TaxID=690164 RepID=A0A917V9U2_9HYPH|nr:NADH-quinone oxidoreductase subunit J [Salinarimonas ramus]GGK53267.1 NADH:ubiquinone oxidoreductase subunit J [Salinarimonas ramus]